MMNCRISNILQKCGINPSHKGYIYLMDAIEKRIESYDKQITVKQSVMQMYYEIGKKYGVSTTSVIRGMGVAINNAKRLKSKLFTEIFDSTLFGKDKMNISTGIFVTVIATYVYNASREKSPQEMISERWCDDCKCDSHECINIGRCKGYKGE